MLFFITGETWKYDINLLVPCNSQIMIDGDTTLQTRYIVSHAEPKTIHNNIEVAKDSLYSLSKEREQNSLIKLTCSLNTENTEENRQKLTAEQLSSNSNNNES